MGTESPWIADGNKGTPFRNQFIVRQGSRRQQVLVAEAKEAKVGSVMSTILERQRDGRLWRVGLRGGHGQDARDLHII